MENFKIPDITIRKNLLTEVYSNIKTFVFTVFQECSSWASRNGTMQFFSDTNQLETCSLEIL